MGLTGQQERFAQLVASGLSQSEAYRQSYNAGAMAPATIWQRASEVAEHSQVSVRIDELRGKVAKRTEWTLERAVRAYERNLEEAFAEKPRGYLSAANQAVRGIAELLGLGKLGSGAPAGDTHQHLHLHEMSTEELRERARKLLEGS